MHPDLPYQIALTQTPSVGSIIAKKLIAHCGSAEQVLKSGKSLLQQIPDIGRVIANNLATTQAIRRAEDEITFCLKNNIAALSFLDEEYPNRLRQCEDSPIVLYFKGSANLNARRIVSVVGTRAATAYGRQLCDTLMKDFAALGCQPLIVSGLAYGIDVAAHRAALKHGLPTAAVVAHGLDILYPYDHKQVSDEMIAAGGAIVSDYMSQTSIHPANFLARNRIIAGIADAVVVVESAYRGGSLTTARLAQEYNRDVFTFPARTSDRQSDGCNALIRDDKAALITCAADLAYAMRWDAERKPKQASFFEDVKLPTDEAKIYAILCKSGTQNIDDICRSTQMPASEVSVLLLNLEFAGKVRSLPGKMFEAVN